MVQRRPIGQPTKKKLVTIGAILVVIAMIAMTQWNGMQVISSWDRVILGRAQSAGVSPRATAAPKRSVRASGGLPAGMVLGYFYDPGNAGNAVTMLKHYLPFLTGIIPFWYTIYANGTISGQTNPQVLTLAAQHHLWTFALVENMAGQKVFGPLLNSPQARHRAIENLLTLVEVNGYDGINLDWEGIAPAERHAYSTFVQQLSAVFHQHGYYVTLSVPAETKSQPSNSWTGAYNYKKLGRYADLVMVMAYDQHWAGGSPGPIASASWVKQVLDYTISTVTPRKVILGIPGYGYNWGAHGATALSYFQANTLSHQYNTKSGQNHFVYMKHGQLHSVWFENTQSVLNKIQFVGGYELRGIALWRLGIEDPKIWNFIQ